MPGTSTGCPTRSRSPVRETKREPLTLAMPHACISIRSRSPLGPSLPQFPPCPRAVPQPSVEGSRGSAAPPGPEAKRPLPSLPRAAIRRPRLVPPRGSDFGRGSPGVPLTTEAEGQVCGGGVGLPERTGEGWMLRRAGAECAPVDTAKGSPPGHGPCQAIAWHHCQPQAKTQTLILGHPHTPHAHSLTCTPTRVHTRRHMPLLSLGRLPLSQCHLLSHLWLETLYLPPLHSNSSKCPFLQGASPAASDLVVPFLGPALFQRPAPPLSLQLCAQDCLPNLSLLHAALPLRVAPGPCWAVGVSLRGPSAQLMPSRAPLTHCLRPSL